MKCEWNKQKQRYQLEIVIINEKAEHKTKEVVILESHAPIEVKSETKSL